jgi:glycerol-3-phosphate acyltransferase PlsY
MENGPHGSYIFLTLYAGASFLLGSVPFGKLIGQRVARIDVTRRGSGNIGAANVAREVGLKWGLMTLAFDLLKGFVPLTVYGLFNAHSDLGVAIIGLCTLLGHQFSLFLGFRGGKGVSTALGIFLVISPLLALIALAFFILTVRVTDYVSLGSLLSALLMVILFVVSGKSPVLIVTAALMAALICLRHGANIRRLMRGEEPGWRKRGR